MGKLGLTDSKRTSGLIRMHEIAEMAGEFACLCKFGRPTWVSSAKSGTFSSRGRLIVASKHTVPLVQGV